MNCKDIIKIVALAVLLVVGGCSPSSLQDFRQEGRRLNRELLAELQKLHTRQEVQQAAPILQQHYQEIVQLMIAARDFQQQHPDDPIPELDETDQQLSRQLMNELNRLYRIEGVREIIEKAQEPALSRLDAFERRIAG